MFAIELVRTRLPAKVLAIASSRPAAASSAEQPGPDGAETKASEADAAEADIARADTLVDLARKEYKPDVTVGATYGLVTGRSDLAAGIMPPPDNGKDVFGISLSLNLPIKRGKLNAGLEEATERRLAAVERKRDVTTVIDRSLGELVGRTDLLRIVEGETRRARWLLAFGGRGRLGRSFFSPPHLNLYTSIVLRPELTTAAAPTWILASAVAVAEEGRRGPVHPLHGLDEVVAAGRHAGNLRPGDRVNQHSRMEHGLHPRRPRALHPGGVRGRARALAEDPRAGGRAARPRARRRWPARRRW